MDDKQWEHHVAKARQEAKPTSRGVTKESSFKANLFFAFVSPVCLFMAFFLPPDQAILLVSSVWLLGGLCSLGVLAAYAYTDNISHKYKEAALSFLLGNLLVFFVFILKPT